MKTKSIPEIEIEKITTYYRLDHNGYYMFVEKIEEDGLINLYTCKKRKDFVFQDSDKDTLKAIGEMLIRASEI